MRIVFAPDSFKGTASAAEVAGALAAGWASVRPGDELIRMPMADGGEGTLDAFEAATPGSLRMPVTVVGPGDRPVATYWLLLPPTDGLPHGTAVVELAAASGLTLLDGPRPLTAHTFGFGQAIAAALDHGVSRVLLAIGGSASTDGGAGMLEALGARLLTSEGRPIPRGGSGLEQLAAVDLTGLRAHPPAVVLSDVTNPLLGLNGAAAVFGPQKGANPAEVAELERGLGRWAELIGTDPELPGAGAAGGTGYALLAWGATMASGAAAVGDALGLPAALAGADAVVTGEGRFDSQTATGKAPAYVAGLAAASGLPVLLAAGAIAAPTDAFAAAVSLEQLAGAGAARSDPVRWLREAGATLARSV